MKEIEIKDVVKVRLKNTANAGHYVTGSVIAIDGEKVKIDLPFDDLNGGWYCISEVENVIPYQFSDEARERINTAIKSLDLFISSSIDAKDHQIKLICELLSAGEGIELLAESMLEPIRSAVDA